MELNRETAMRLWNKSFGKDTKVTDFAGRTMAKGAYNDRKSEFGWNVDHILPQSKGGATADYNLICCHIKTNDEKANTFPCFNANGKSFEIIKVQNHYEIRERNGHNSSPKKVESDELDFLDSASGVRFFKKLKGIQKNERFIGTVFVRLFDLNNPAIIDFIEKLMEMDMVAINKQGGYGSYVLTTLVMRNCNMPLKEDTAELLDKCVVLNTYLSAYFEPSGYIEGYEIYYREDCFTNRISMYEQLRRIDYRNMTYSSSDLVLSMGYLLPSDSRDSLFVNEAVLENTIAGDRITRWLNNEYAEYNYIKRQLDKNLNKEVKG